MRQGSNARRPRGRPHRKQHGGAPRHNNFDSNGPEGRIRGNAHQVYEKYIALARDALSSGDRITAETYFQHAEHYYRIVNARTDPRPAPDGASVRQDGNGRAESGSTDAANGADGPAQAVPGMGEQPRVSDTAASTASGQATGQDAQARTQARRRRKPARNESGDSEESSGGENEPAEA